MVRKSIRLILLVLIIAMSAAVNVETAPVLSAEPTSVSEHSVVASNLTFDPKILSPRISFEKTICDLGDVGQGTKNTCEFRFTNTGRGLLKIGKISRTCGCTVFHLDKKQYPPNKSGTIKVIYTAGKSTGTKNLRKSTLICV
ncbi:MAG: DUF1573 domain-containing protein [Sedimentisphaerales bacterium]